MIHQMGKNHSFWYCDETLFVDLPPHWEVKIDPVTGWPFFVDHTSRRTTWDDPRYYEPGTRTSASANFESRPDNLYPSKQERCHEVNKRGVMKLQTFSPTTRRVYTIYSLTENSPRIL